MCEHQLPKKLIVVCAVLVNLGGWWLGLFRLNNSSLGVLSSKSTADAFADLVNLFTRNYAHLIAEQAKKIYLFAEDVAEAQLLIL
jgi:hypothetical protein